MNKINFLIALSAMFISLGTYGQNFHIQGTVRDSLTQKTLESVVVDARSINASQSNQAAITNVNGNYSLKIPSGTYKFAISILGYKPIQKEVDISSDLTFDIELSPLPFSLGEVVVSSFRVNRSIKDLPTPLAVISKYDYQNHSAITLSNVLANEPGVAMGSDGVWATNVNIRGFGENRLVTLIDGFRIETATDLTASLSMIDVNDIERVEVVKGAQSALYGTGAMGGIVNIITKDGQFGSQPYISGNVVTGFASANEQFGGYASLNTGSEKWYLKLSGTYNDAQNIKTPEGILPNSQFTSNNISTRFGFKPFANHLLKLQYQNYNASDVGIPGGSAFPGPATATYTNIGRQLLSASYEINDLTESFSSLKLSYYNQYILRDVSLIPNVVTEVNIPTGMQRISPQEFTPTGEHTTNGAQLQGTWSLGSKNTFVAGIDAWARKLETDREKYIKVEVFNTENNLVATNNLVRGETPIPTSIFGSAGIFAQNETRLLNDRLTLITGGRLDGIYIENEQGFDIDYLIVNDVLNESPPNQRITFEKGEERKVSWSANAGILYNLLNDVDLSMNVARSFRAPSLEESFKYIDLGNLVRLGDPTLKPESGYATDLGLRVWKQNLIVQVGVFANWLTNMIVETPGEFIYTINTGPSQGLTDTLPALINANVSKAILYGTDMKFEYNFFSNAVIFGSGAFVRGVDKEFDTNLPQIPPFNGRLGFRYNLPQYGSVQTTLVGSAEQDKIAEGEKETAGWARLDIALSSAKLDLGFSKIQIFAGIDNVTNASYTNHLATNRGAISIEPGRNIYIRASISF
jgi:hemoglobin/transferrin/lactoferrin receptor protein